MKQQSLGLGQSSKRTRRREFLGEMERVVPWTELVSLVAPQGDCMKSDPYFGLMPSTVSRYFGLQAAFWRLMLRLVFLDFSCLSRFRLMRLRMAKFSVRVQPPLLDASTHPSTR